MKQLFKEDLNDLSFDGIIIGIPSYEEMGQHNDLFFQLNNNQVILYNSKDLSNGLISDTMEKFRFDCYDYYKFDDMIEFCEWYLKKHGKPIPNAEVTSGDIIKRKDKLADVRSYVKQVLNIEYYKNFSLFNINKDRVTGVLAEDMAEKLKQQLIDWLEEPV